MSGAKVTEAHRERANLAVCGGCFPGPHHVHTRDRVAQALAEAEAGEREACLAPLREAIRCIKGNPAEMVFYGVQLGIEARGEVTA